MEAPKCKLCGQRHYEMCAKPEEDWLAAQRELGHDVKIVDGGSTFIATVKFDRTAYQRELMRKRRAKTKEAGK